MDDRTTIVTGASQEARHFASDLEALKEQLLGMGRAAEERLRTALAGLINRDESLLTDVVFGDSRLNDLEIAIDQRCFEMMALHQPVAVDLRTVVSVLKINNDLERVGDLAVNVAEAGQRYLQHPPVKPLIDLPRMGDLALKMLREALEAFLQRDASLANAVLRQDDWLDALTDQVFREVLTYMFGTHSTIEPGTDLILISRHLERVGDHASNIAEDVIFLVEGRDVRHGLSDAPAVERRQRWSPTAI
jgi:phosphate transport system protein